MGTMLHTKCLSIDAVSALGKCIASQTQLQCASTDCGQTTHDRDFEWSSGVQCIISGYLLRNAVVACMLSARSMSPLQCVT